MLSSLFVSLFLTGILAGSAATATTGGDLQVRVDQAGTHTSVAPGMQRVEMLRLELTADCRGAVPLHSITVYRMGLGARTDIDGLYLLEGSNRLTSVRPVSRRDGAVQLSLRRFVLPACATVHLSVMADFAADADPAGEHRIVLRSLSDIDAGGSSVTGALPSLYPRVRVAGPSRGSITVHPITLTTPKTYGTGRKLLRFQLEADGEDDQRITAITFTNDGSASNADIQNLVLEDARRNRLSQIAPAMDDDHVRLTFDPPLLLERNDKRLFILKGDVRASRRRTIDFGIKEMSDIETE